VHLSGVEVLNSNIGLQQTAQDDDAPMLPSGDLPPGHHTRVMTTHFSQPLTVTALYMYAYEERVE
jgi:hypothetical protein